MKIAIVEICMNHDCQRIRKIIHADENNVNVSVTTSEWFGVAEKCSTGEKGVCRIVIQLLKITEVIK